MAMKRSVLLFLAIASVAGSIALVTVATPALATSYDSYSSPYIFAGGSDVHVTFDFAGSSTEANEKDACSGGTATHRSLWIKYNPASGGTFYVTGQGAYGDCIAIYTDPDNIGDDIPVVRSSGSCDEFDCYPPSVNVTAVANHTYYAQIHSASNNVDFGMDGPAATSPTTTTTVPTTTTTTMPPSNCGRTDATGNCVDQVEPPTVVNISGCNTIADNSVCSSFWATDDDENCGSGQFCNPPPASEWKLIRRGNILVPHITRNGGASEFLVSNSGAYWVSTGSDYPICVAYLDGTYSTLVNGWRPNNLNGDAYAPNTGQGGQGIGDVNYIDGGIARLLPLNVAYMWRNEGDNGCSSSGDPTTSTNDKPVVPTPTIDCNRVFVDNGDGTQDVIIRAISPSHSGATDVVTIRFPWESTERVGTSFRVRVPPLYAMPPGGWKGICKVTRTVTVTTHRGSTGWKQGAIEGKDVPHNQIQNNDKAKDSGCTLTEGTIGEFDIRQYQCQGEQSENEAFTVPPSVIPAVPIILTPAVNPSILSAPIGVNTPTVAGIPAAAYAGWNLGGMLIGAWGGDDEWFCRWNPGYKLAHASFCNHLNEDRPYLRQEVFLEDAFAQPIQVVSTQDWIKGIAVAEVLINPTMPELGRRTTTSVEIPTVNPEQQTQIQQAIGEDAATDRTTAQEAAEPDEDRKADASIETDPRPPQEEASPEPTIEVPPPGDEDEGNCELSIWEIMNPFNIASTMACFLKKLFIPDDGFDGLTKLWGEMSDKIPFSYLKQTIGFVPTLINSITAATKNADCVNLLPNGLNDIPGLDRSVSLSDQLGCPQSTASVLYPARGFFDIVRSLIFLIFMIGMGFGVYRLITWAIT